MHRSRGSVSLLHRLLLGLVFLVGCVGPGKKLEPPQITLTNIQVQEIKVFESVFQIDLRVVNPNDVDIDITPAEAGSGAEKPFSYRRNGQVKNLMVKVPAGIKNGNRIRLKGMGIISGNNTGDLYLHVRIKD